MPQWENYVDTEAAGLLIASGGIGMCIEETKACWIIFHLGQSQEIPFWSHCECSCVFKIEVSLLT